MNEFELGMKLAQLEMKLEQLQQQQSTELTENSNSFKSTTFANIVALEPETGEVLSPKDLLTHKVYKSTQNPRVRISGGLFHGNTGIPKWRNYNEFSGFLELIDDNGNPIKCNIITTSSDEGCYHIRPKKGQWEYFQDHDSKCFYGFHGRMYGPHKLFSTWAEFRTYLGQRWFVNLNFGCS